MEDKKGNGVDNDWWLHLFEPMMVVIIELNGIALRTIAMVALMMLLVSRVWIY